MNSIQHASLWKKYNNYCQEAGNIEKKLQRPLGPEKEEKLRFRLKDLHDRLIPRVISSLTVRDLNYV